MSFRPARVLVPLLIVLGLLGVAPNADAASGDTSLVIISTLVSTDSSLNTYGSLQYGTINFTGTAVVNGENVSIIRNAVVDYRSNNGPIGGFLTFLWPDGSRISMRASGSSASVGARANFLAALEVFSTSGKWTNYVGSGTMRGSRTGALGTPITYTFRVNLLEKA